MYGFTFLSRENTSFVHIIVNEIPVYKLKSLHGFLNTGLNDQRLVIKFQLALLTTLTGGVL